MCGAWCICVRAVCVCGWEPVQVPIYTGSQSALLLLHSFVEQHSSERQQGQRSGGKDEPGYSLALQHHPWSMYVCSVYIYVCMCGCVFVVRILIANNWVNKAKAYHVLSFVFNAMRQAAFKEHPGMYTYCTASRPALAALPPQPLTAALTRVCIPESAPQHPRKASPVRPQPVDTER